MPARQRAVVAMIDGLDPAYVTEEAMPVFGRLAAEGTSRVVQAVMPLRAAPPDLRRDGLGMAQPGGRRGRRCLGPVAGCPASRPF